jgi:precorrin-6A/cobalt-precorrin-6A reductase
MTPNLLILGGTTEATALCRRLADVGLRGTCSFAGRVDRPARQPLPQRVGGFGGVEGLARYLEDHQVTHVVDATHPFAEQISSHAMTACAQMRVPLAALTRPPWQAQAGDQWTRVPGIAGAVEALDRAPARVMLAVGRMHLDAFAPNPQHFYLLRLLDPPKAPLPFPNHRVIVDRGPFTLDGDRSLMEANEIEIVVSKNSGGSGAVAKIEAARALGLPVIMIDRPAMPQRLCLHQIDEVLGWVSHSATDLGV